MTIKAQCHFDEDVANPFHDEAACFGGLLFRSPFHQHLNSRKIPPRAPVYELALYALYAHNSESAAVRVWVPESTPEHTRLGFAWFDDDDLAREGISVAQAFALLEAWVDTFSSWANGGAWWVRLFEEKACPTCGAVEKVELDTCGGFIGETLEVTGILETFAEQYHEAIKEAWETRYG